MAQKYCFFKKKISRPPLFNRFSLRCFVSKIFENIFLEKLKSSQIKQTATLPCRATLRRRRWGSPTSRTPRPYRGCRRGNHGEYKDNNFFKKKKYWGIYGLYCRFADVQHRATDRMDTGEDEDVHVRWEIFLKNRFF